jgi:hypothetical protein
MLHQFREEEGDVPSDEEEQMTILSCLLQLQALEDAATPGRGGSKFVQEKSKHRQRMEGHAILYTKYFAMNESTYNAKYFCPCYRMKKDLLMRIVHGVREFDN